MRIVSNIKLELLQIITYKYCNLRNNMVKYAMPEDRGVYCRKGELKGKTNYVKSSDF